MTFSEKMKELRKKTGKSQEQVSQEIGIAISTLRYYENGRLPDTFQLKKIKNYYNVPYEYLLDDNCNNISKTTLNIGQELKLSDNAIEKIKNLQYLVDDIKKCKSQEIFDNSISPKYFNFFIENFNIRALSYEIHSFLDMIEIFKNTNLFISFREFYDYMVVCIKKQNTKDLEPFFDFFEKKMAETHSLIIDTDITSFLIDDLIEQFDTIKKIISNKKITDLQNEMDTFLEISIEIYSMAYRQIKYFRYSISDLTNDFTSKILEPLEFDSDNIIIFKFKDLKKYYKYVKNQKYLGKDFI